MRRILRRRQTDDEQILEGEIIEDDDSSGDESSIAAEKPHRRGFWGRSRESRRETSAQNQERALSLERVAPDIPTPDEMIHDTTRRAAPEPEFTSRRRFRLPRFNLNQLIVWREVRPGLLFLASGLIIGGVFWTLLNLGRVSQESEQWWPAALLIFALLWSLISLITRRAGALLASTTLAGMSVSLLLDTQGYVTWQDTLIGVVLVTIGVGIIIRGFLLRQGSVA